MTAGSVQADSGAAAPVEARQWVRMRWRAWNTFVATLAVAFAAFGVSLAAALLLGLAQGGLTAAQAELLLGLLRYGSYPVVFVALGSLLWHYVRLYRGDYARR